MNCKEFRDKMFMYPEVEEEFFLHLNECEECKKEFSFYLNNIENRLSEKVLERESHKEWKDLYGEVLRKLESEKRKRNILLFGLISLEVILASWLSYIFIKFIFSDFSLFLLTVKGLLEIAFNYSYIIGIILLFILAISLKLNIKNRF
ncbi:MAG TPA: hypothetical protein PKW23_04500 [Dictyoglomaceae bacterium]|nr:hypothetical protein [Dictyoglomaceae bacterium]HOL39767.1 hypothetical protein [Dictyoglomaceae bacterium]HPP16253.1 hypothetical protein [Dictyoglomaceae bacterium]